MEAPEHQNETTSSPEASSAPAAPEEKEPVPIYAKEDEPPKTEAPVPKKKKSRRMLWIAGAALGIAAASAAVYEFNFSPAANFKKGSEAYAAGEYESAVQFFTNAGEYENAAQCLALAEDAIHYTQACRLMEDGNYSGAKEELSKANGYEDTAAKLDECNYNIAKSQQSEGDLLSAAQTFHLCQQYGDSAEQLLQIGKTLTEQKNYEDAVLVLDYLSTRESAQIKAYALGAAAMARKDYSEAISDFEDAGNQYDAAEQYKEAQYQYAAALVKSKKYDKAETELEKVTGYKDADTLILTCRLVSAAEELDDGQLSKAKATLDELPEDLSADDVSVSELRDKLQRGSQWVALAGKWTTTGGQMRSTQSGSYTSHWWYRDFSEGECTLDVKCYLMDDGTANVSVTGYVPVYTSYSSIRAGVHSGIHQIDIDRNLRSMGTYTLDDDTSITLSTSGISVSYRKVDNSQDVYFTYTYTTNMTFGEKTESY